MTFLEILEVVVSTLIIYLGITQVLIPWAKGTLCFPMFRRTRQMEERLKQAKQELEEAQLITEADKIEKKVKEEKQKWSR